MPSVRWIMPASPGTPVPRRLLFAVVVALLASCTSDQPTEVPAPPAVKPKPAFVEVGCTGCRRDNFTDADGTLLEHHVSDGDGPLFTWVKTFGGTAFRDTAVIQNNAVGKSAPGYWRYITNAVEADSIELEVEVAGDMVNVSHQYDVDIILRNNDPGNGGFTGYDIFWSFYGNGDGTTHAFITISRPDRLLIDQEDNVPVPTRGTHTFGAAVLPDGRITAYIDGVLTATAVDPEPLPKGNAGLSFGFNFAPPSIVTITTFAQGLHTADSATVKVARAAGEVWPSGLGPRDGAGGPTQAQLQVSVELNDTLVKNKWVKLSLAAVDSGGTGSDQAYGHFHRGRDDATRKPIGSLSEDSVNTGTSGIGVVQYTSSPVSGPVVARGEIPGGRPGSVTIPVGVPGLEQLVPNGTFKIVGVQSIHPSSNWVTRSTNQQAMTLAQHFFAKFHKPFSYNDASLPFGGKFDLEQQWDQPASEACKLNGQHNPAGCHQRHRVGRNIDFPKALTQGELGLVRDIWLVKLHGYVGPEADHYHLFSH
jgi:hypothetical protein